MPTEWKERDFQKHLVKKLKTFNCKVLNFVGSSHTGGGVPDLYVAHANWQGWLELKIDRGRVTELQKHTMRDLVERGAKGLFVWYYNATGEVEVSSPEGEYKFPTLDLFVQALLRSR